MNPITLKIKLIIAAVIITTAASAGLWFRGVLADNKEMKNTVKEQAQTIKDVTEEVDRMNKMDALDYALFENVESQKKLHAAESKKLTADLKRLREKFDEKTTDCFNRPLPAEYLERLLSD